MSDYTTSGYPVGVGYDANGNAKVFKELSSITITGGLSATTISATTYEGIPAGNLPAGANNNDILYYDGGAAWLSPTATPLNLATTGYVDTALEPYALTATLDSYIATSVISESLETVYNNGGVLESLTLTHPVTAFMESNAQVTALSDIEVLGSLGSDSVLVYDATSTTWKNRKFSVYTNATESFQTVVGPTGNLELRFTNTITSPPGTTGDSDINSGFVYVSGANASSTTIVGDEFGRTWVTGPDQDISDGNYLIYWSAAPGPGEPIGSGTVGLEMNSEVLDILQTGYSAIDLSTLGDVNFTDLGGPAGGGDGELPQHLEWDGTQWVNKFEDEQYIEIKNNTGAQLKSGQAIFVSGFSGDKALVGLAKADSATTMPCIGLVYGNIANSEDGLATTFGSSNLDGSLSFGGTGPSGPGTTIYVSPTVAGGITVDKPTGASHLIQNVGLILSDTSKKVKVTGVGRANDIPNRDGLLAKGLPVTFHSDFGAPVVSSNSTSLTEVTSITIPGGTLTNHGVEVEIRGRVYGQGQNLRMSFDLGGTTIMNSQISQGTASVFYGYSMLLKITRTGDNTQFVTAHFLEGGGFDAATGHGGWSSMHREGFMYEETSANEGTDLALDFNVQHSANASGENFTIESVVARIIPA